MAATEYVLTVSVGEEGPLYEPENAQFQRASGSESVSITSEEIGKILQMLY